ncbi:MAG: hypothetical protein KAJ13_10730 [Gemmatimonadetes bacterium]|nr:hypothetical protein [Gemmatimonadota bacterium]
MNRRIAMLLAAFVAIVASAPPLPSEAAVVGKTWCMTYCDVIHLGCKKTFGWFDQEACEEWKMGCMDGCRVNG